MGLGPVFSKPQAASMLVAGFPSQKNEPLLVFVCLLPASVKLQLRCQESLRAQIMGQDTELHSDEGCQDHGVKELHTTPPSG